MTRPTAGSQNEAAGATLGRIVFSPGRAVSPEIACEDAALRRHADCPWMRAYVARQFGLSAPPSPSSAEAAPAKGDPAVAPDWALARHFLIAGSSGGGKSMLCECLLCQLLDRGQSCVILDPKLETITRLAARARLAGVPPDRIAVVAPRLTTTAGWNPFLAGVPAAQAAQDFVALIARSSPSWGVRLGDLLMNAAIVAAAHGLSPYEMVQLLTRDGYAGALLRAAPPGPPSAAYDEAADFFRTEFLAWAPSARADAVSAVTNKTRELLRNEFLSGLLCARRNTLKLPDLWRGQRVVLVHLDRASLGEEGARLLGGLVAAGLFRTALRASGDVPVNLLLDELATTEHFVGETLVDIVTTARSYNLRLVAACQHLAALTAPLRSALLGNTAVQAFCRLGPEDARLVAASLAAGTPSRLTRLHADVAERRGRTARPVLATWPHVVRDAEGLAVRVPPAAWGRMRWDGLFGESALAALHSHAGAGRLYVDAADTGQPVELRRYVAGLSPEEFWLDGPAPLSLVVGFPRPRLSGAQRATEADAVRAWTRALQDMPVQHAAFKVAGQAPVVVRVRDMGDPLNGADGLLESSARAGGQSAEEVAQVARWRQAAVARSVAGASPDATGDGSPETPRAVRRGDEPAGRNGGPTNNRGSGLNGAQGPRGAQGGNGNIGQATQGRMKGPVQGDGRLGEGVPRTGGLADDGSLA